MGSLMLAARGAKLDALMAKELIIVASMGACIPKMQAFIPLQDPPDSNHTLLKRASLETGRLIRPTTTLPRRFIQSLRMRVPSRWFFLTLIKVMTSCRPSTLRV